MLTTETGGSVRVTPVRLVEVCVGCSNWWARLGLFDSAGEYYFCRKIFLLVLVFKHARERSEVRYGGGS